ncbi:MAG: Arc family DNA binding domain-containing protein [Atopobiaceae bacterium]|nr:Arc family DNA binding domain-containing protein [Atopobiaceae bacterium]MDO4404868.1 Arc family DNA binding domain-containing protein [Atopobiaceae bacterium]
MARRKQYPLRIDPDIWEAIEKWAADDMRSANGQVEWVLRQALKQAGRLPARSNESKQEA